MNLEKYFERCAVETARNPLEAVDLVLQAPEHVEREAVRLGDEYENFRLRALGLLGTVLTLAGNSAMASMIFDVGGSLKRASDEERAGLFWRYSLFELYGSNWMRARELADEAVTIFESGAQSLRDDCSLSAALGMRGMVEGVAYQEGIDGFDLQRACEFFRRSLSVSRTDFRMSRLTAVGGLGRCLVSSWMGMGIPSSGDVGSLAEMLVGIRGDLKGRRGADLLDSNVRWLLGLALHRLMGGLGMAATSHLEDSRRVLLEVGRESDVRWITLDYQWCLIADGAFGRALAECEMLSAVGMDPSVLDVWRGAISRRLVTNRIAGEVFRKARGSRGVLSPQGNAEPGRGWDRGGCGCGGARGGGEYGF